MEENKADYLDDDALRAMSEAQDGAEPPVEEPVAEPPAGEPPAEEAQATEAPKEDNPQPPEGFVPYGALKEEREARKALNAEVEKLRAWREQVEAEKPKEEPPAPPDIFEDPNGFVDFAQKPAHDLRQEFAEFKQEMQQQQEMQRLSSQVMAAESAFVKEKPDYHEAIAAMRQNALTEYQLFGASEQEAMARVHQDSLNIARMAFQSGKNPAEIAYQMACNRGWSAPQKAEEARFEQAAKVAGASKTLAGSGGQAAVSETTAEDLENLSLADIAAMSEEDLRRAAAR